MNEPTPSDIGALVDAMAQLLDDMGRAGQSVCLAAKAQARMAFEPFRNEDNYPGDEYWMKLSDAQEIVQQAAFGPDKR